MKTRTFNNLAPADSDKGPITSTFMGLVICRVLALAIIVALIFNLSGCTGTRTPEQKEAARIRRAAVVSTVGAFFGNLALAFVTSAATTWAMDRGYVK